MRNPVCGKQVSGGMGDAAHFERVHVPGPGERRGQRKDPGASAYIQHDIPGAHDPANRIDVTRCPRAVIQHPDMKENGIG